MTTLIKNRYLPEGLMWSTYHDDEEASQHGLKVIKWEWPWNAEHYALSAPQSKCEHENVI